MKWLYARWLEMRLAWLTVKMTRLQYEAQQLKREAASIDQRKQEAEYVTVANVATGKLTKYLVRK